MYPGEGDAEKHAQNLDFVSFLDTARGLSLSINTSYVKKVNITSSVTDQRIKIK